MTVNFTEARPGEDAWVYKCPPGWEYGWVTDTEYFTDNLADPLTVTRQQWQLIDTQEVTFYPAHMLCEQCGGDEFVCDRDGCPNCRPVKCTHCNGTGEDPRAGTMAVTKR